MNKKVKIIQKPKSSMQSGHGIHQWEIVFPIEHERYSDPLTGWVGSTEKIIGKIDLTFDTVEDAIMYVEHKNWEYELVIFKSNIQKKSYSDNFKNNRRQSWTH